MRAEPLRSENHFLSAVKSLSRLIFCLLVFTGAMARGTDDETIVSRFLRYRNLTRLTAEQIDMVEASRTLCITPSSIHGPHLEPGIHLYANRLAIEERKDNPGSHHFSVGTLLVKEKFKGKGSDQPDLITVMEKVTDTGKVDDWQFTMIQIADRTIVRDGFTVSCTKCHSRFPESDFVSHLTDALVTNYALTGAPRQGARRK